MSNLQPVPPPEEGPEAKAYDPFDPATLRVNTAADLSVEKVLTRVPVKKPDRREFFRVHPGSSYELDTLLLERNDGMDREAYIVARQIQHLVLPELRRVRLFTAITRRGVVFLWPVKLPIEGEDRFRRISDTAFRLQTGRRPNGCGRFGTRISVVMTCRWLRAIWASRNGPRSRFATC